MVRPLSTTVLASALSLAGISLAYASDIGVATANTHTKTLSVGKQDRPTAHNRATGGEDASIDLVADATDASNSAMRRASAISVDGFAKSPISPGNDTVDLLRSQSDAFRINLDITSAAERGNAGSTLLGANGHPFDFNLALKRPIENLTAGVIQAKSTGTPLASAADIVIASGTTTTKTQSVSGTDQLTVQAGGALSVDDTAIKWNDASTDLIIDNSGTIESTATEGRAINASGSATSPRTITLNNYAGGLIQSQDDAFRINIDITSGIVTVNNAGTILSSVDGQALDFDNVDSTGTSTAQILINNQATGVIQANGADAIRPGEGATVTNAGLIYSNGIIGDSNDGIDFQSHSGTVVNLAGGTISGQRHGITTDTDVIVYNAAGGTIIGRNGSGVGSDGNGKVVNYGTILGEYVGTGDGDGDGVDIDYRGEVDNYGTIEGTGAAGTKADGRPNSSEGVTITNGGYVYNHAGGYISGIATGITTGGAMTITNEGTIVGGSYGIWSAGPGTYGGNPTVINSGSITGGIYAIDFETVDGTLVIEKGSTLTGLVEGGTGRSSIYLEDGAVFDSSSDFALMQADGNAIVTGDNVVPQINIVPGARLQLGNGGTSGMVTGAIVDNGTLAFDRSDAITVADTISGTGAVEQAGIGTTVLSGANSYSGSTSVLAGTLQAGSATAFGASSSFAVASGATLATAGYNLQTASLNNSGTVSLQGSGTAGAVLEIDGAYTSNGGHIAMNINPAQGVSDKIVLNGPSATTIGTTMLDFTAVGGFGKSTTGNGINIVEAINGATTNSNAFSLGYGSTQSGAYSYSIYDSQNNWYLRSSLRAAVPTYMAVPGFAQQLTSIGAMHERTDDSLRTDADSRVWVRVSGRSGEHNAGDFNQYGSSYSYNQSAVQAGVDLISSADTTSTEGHPSGNQAGLYLSSAYGNGRVDGLDGARYSGTLNGQADSLGAYWTHYFATGAYLDAVAQASRYTHVDANTANSEGSISANGSGLAASIEAGYPIRLSERTVLEPEAQIIGTRTDIDSNADQSSTVTFNRPWQWTSRLGARLLFDQSATSSLWASADILHVGGASQKTTFSTLDGDYPDVLNTAPGMTWSQLGVGYSQQFSKNFSVYTGFAITFPVAGERGDRSIASRVGLKYSL